MKKVALVFVSVLSVFILMSCGSKPAPEEPEVEAPVVEEEQVQEPEEPEVADNSEILALVDKAREEAIASGAKEKAADQFNKIEKLYEALKSQTTDATAEGNDLVSRYQLLTNYIKAKDAKDKIDQNDLASYAQNNYNQGVEDLAVVDSAFESDGALDSKVYTAANDAYVNFNTVIIVAYKKMAKAEREAAYQAKKSADSVKAGVSQKDRYQAATDSFQKGDTLYAMQAAEKAYENYKSAKDEYLALYEEVSSKRAAAAAAIEAAKKRVAESAEYAEKADTTSPITEKVEGIEDEDAVLLEADNYENPEDAEIDVSEELDVLETIENVVTDELVPVGELK